MEEVVLVDKFDNEIGTAEKIEAHRRALLHRAFSVIIFNTKGEMLIHQRAGSKYHSPLLWTNACCSHPRPGESLENACERRLREEIGLSAEVEHQFSFVYKVKLEGDMFEHELDHVFVGTTDQDPTLNPEEVEAFRYISLEDLKREIGNNPENFTFWFKEIMNRFEP